MKPLDKEILKEFFKQTFSLLDRDEATQLLKDKGYITDEGFVVHKFSDEVFELGEREICPFDKGMLALLFDMKKHGSLVWINLIVPAKDGEGESRAYSVDLDNNELYNLLYVAFDSVYDAVPATVLLYNTDWFCDLMYEHKDVESMRKALVPAEKNAYSWAPNAGCIQLCNQKYMYFKPFVKYNSAIQQEYYEDFFPVFQKMFLDGATEPARVVSLNPFVVSCYSGDLDCVRLLRFPIKIAEKYNLQVGDKLITVNHYRAGIYDYPEDLIIGENATKNWIDFVPKVALFFAKNENFCKFKVKLISPNKWERLDKLTQEYIEQKPGVVSNGLDFLLI